MEYRRMLQHKEEELREGKDLPPVPPAHPFSGFSAITFPRPVFFVPGWRDDNAQCWTKANGQGLSMQHWIRNVATNPQEVYFVNFVTESRQCRDFWDLGKCFKKKVKALVGNSRAFDVVAHGMGGLAIRASLVDEEPLLNAHTCITIATAHRGRQIRGTQSLLNRFMRQRAYHTIQSKSLDSDSQAMKEINALTHRRLFLERVDKLYQFSRARDSAAGNVCLLDGQGIEVLYQQKTREVVLEGSQRLGDKTMTQDPRTILAVIKILTGTQ